MPTKKTKEELHEDTVGFFVFDYDKMDTQYGRQAFEAICEALRLSSGVCAFNDGDIFNPEIVRAIARQANLIVPSTSASPLARLADPCDFGAYVAAMWTDEYANFKLVHDTLASTTVPGYLGYMTLQGKHKFENALELFSTKLSLPPGIVIKNGAMVKGTSKYGVGSIPADESLLRAARSGDINAARKAVAAGAEVDCIDPEDGVATPIVYAASAGHVELVKFLLEKGANPNARMLGSNTALMLAARFGHIEVVKALIAANVDVNAQDRNGDTALDNASSHPEIQRILKQAGAR